MKENYMNYDYDITGSNDAISNRRNSKNYKTQKKTINFEIPLADMLSKEGIKKLKMIK